jgi:phosphoglycerate dehydrogenase-like enzyme
MTTIAIIDPFHPRIIETLEAALPAEWDLSVATGPTEAEHRAAVAAAEFAFVMATPFPRPLVEAATRLRFIQKLGAGVDRIDLDACRERGIAVARLQAGNAIPVAELTLLHMLAASRNLPRLDRQTRAGRWDKEAVRGSNQHLHGKTIGLVGLGAIGRQVARLLQGFGVEIVYFDPHRAPADLEAALGARFVELDDLVREADVVSLHLPLLPETRGLLDRGRIAAMKPTAILVNCARGGLVDEAALAEALGAGRIFAAGIDAFAVEPPAGSPLLALENTVVTPHCAGATIDNFASIAARAVGNAQRVLADEPLPPADLVVAP